VRSKFTVYRLQAVVIAFFLTLVIFLLPSAFGLQPIYAAEEFGTSYDVTYDVSLDGVTTVTEKVTLKNLTSEYYATNFSLTIGSTAITDVTASDSSGALETNVEKKGTSTTITVKFNQQVVGAGKTLPWTLSFKSRDFASKQGSVWEVSVPKVVASTNLQSYNLTLAVPTSFGVPTSITPTPIKQSADFNKLFLNFSKEQLTDQGVLANFGDKQLFDFDLSYHLQNPNLVSVLTNIALPPDTDYQDVFYSRIDPKPINVTVDADGNYLAWYKLGRSQKLDVRVVGSSKLYINSKTKNPTLDANLQAKYTAPAKYWDSNHPTIKTKLTEILGEKSPVDSSSNHLSNFEKAKLIQRWVASNLTYDSKRLSGTGVERLGAVTALANPTQAVCMEFTDLFIALARAAGIPARELNGYAYTANPELRPLSLTRDILHAWPEFWDESRGWVMVDPTWESTTGGVDYFSKLDLNHFTFVVKGLSSEQPIPAGSYKYVGQDSRDVKVEFATEDFQGKPQIDVAIDVADTVLSGWPTKAKIQVQNLGNAVAPSNQLTVKSNTITILQTQVQTGPIPAFGTGEFEMDLRTKSLLDNYDDEIVVEIAGQKFTKTIHVRPILAFQNFPVGLVLLGLVLGGIYFGTLGTFIYRRKYMRKEVEKPVDKRKK
jgi:transglutaminase-like putative cysteine protease